MQLTDLQWEQVASIIAAGIPIESIERNLGLQRYEINERCKAIDEPESFIGIKIYEKVVSKTEVPPNWLTPSELSLLAVRIVGRGITVAGRVVLPCEPAPKVDRETGDILIESTRKHNLYCLSTVVVRRLWELRPDQDTLVIRKGDHLLIDTLMKKMVSIMYCPDVHWLNIDLSQHQSQLIQIKETNLTKEEKAHERESLLRSIGK